MPRSKMDVEQIGWHEQIRENISISGSLTITGSIFVNNLGSDSNVLLVGPSGEISSTSTLYIDETNGRVGMNTTAPQEQFHIHGNNATLRLGNGSNSGEHSVKLELSEQSNADGNMNYGFSVGYNGSSNKFEIRKYANSTGGSTQLTIDRTSGDVVLTNGLHVSGSTSIEDYVIAELSIPGLDLQTDTNAFRFNCPYGLTIEGLTLYLDQHTTSGNVTVTATNTTDSNQMISLSIGGTSTSATTSTVSNASCDSGDIITFAITATPANAQGLRANLRFRRNI